MLRFIGPLFIFPFAEKYTKRNISSKRRELETILSYSSMERSQLLRNQLVTVLQYAAVKVPYYREIFNKINFTPEKVRSDLRYIEEIPFLTKSIILAEGDRLISDDYRGQWLHSRKTGGSTGLSAVIRYSQEDLDWTAAVNLVLNKYTTRKFWHNEVHFSAKFSENISFINRIYGLVKNISMNRENVFIGALTDQECARIYRQLKQIKPFIIQGHPSTLYALSLFLEANGLDQKALCRAFESTGESLNRVQVDHIEKHVKCEVYNRYGSAEFGVVAHSAQDPFILEVIESVAYPETQSTSDGTNELILTGLLNRAMPLIRYRTGDLADVVSDNGVYSLKNLSGRVHDLVHVKGVPVATHFIQDVLDRLNAHREFQVIVDKTTNEIIKILIVPTDSPLDSHVVAKELGQHLGTANIQVEYVSFDAFVKVGWREKFRRVASYSS